MSLRLEHEFYKQLGALRRADELLLRRERGAALTAFERAWLARAVEGDADRSLRARLALKDWWRTRFLNHYRPLDSGRRGPDAKRILQ